MRTPRSRLLWAPKRGETRSDDRSSIARHGGGLLRIAVSDGASEPIFSGIWARMLARAYTRRRYATPQQALSLASGRLGDAWRQTASAATCDDPVRRALQEAKVRRGSGATLLALELGQRGTWQAFAYGDTCLFHFRDSALIRSFPMLSADDFPAAPDLVSTRPELNDRLEPAKTAAGAWRVGDVFLLATDALSRWILREVEIHGPAAVHGELASLTRPTFPCWVERLRAAGALQNDDVTLRSLML